MTEDELTVHHKLLDGPLSTALVSTFLKCTFIVVY